MFEQLVAPNNTASSSLYTVGRRAFPVSGAYTWNDLPYASTHLQRHSRFSDSIAEHSSSPAHTPAFSSHLYIFSTPLVDLVII